MTDVSKPPQTTAKPRYWRSLKEFQQSPEFDEFLHREFPQGASEFPEGVSRRRWLQLMGASFSLAGVAGCRWANEELLPFADQGGNRTAGEPQYFASARELGGHSLGLLVTCMDGRPIKVDGNPDHPQFKAAVGGDRGKKKPHRFAPSDQYAQGMILNLYDPDRMGPPVEMTAEGGKPRDEANVSSLMAELRSTVIDNNGEGLAILADISSSPTRARIEALIRQRYPQCTWYEYSPLAESNVAKGMELAFGRRLRPHLRLKKADVIVSLDGDFIGWGGEQLVNIAGWAARRSPESGKKMNRLYVAESQYSQTGANADHRLPIQSGKIAGLLTEIESQVDKVLGGGEADSELPFVKALVEDLRDAGESGLVVAGRTQPPEVHARVMRLNEKLGAIGSTVVLTEDPRADADAGPEGLGLLVDQLNAGAVETLLILGGNPVYDAPADLKFGEAMGKAGRSIRLGEYRDETSMQATWHIPATHEFEQWGDGRSYDGTITLQQPLIEPLHGGRSQIEFLAELLPELPSGGRSIVRQTHAENLSGASAWEKAVHDGFIPETGLSAVEAEINYDEEGPAFEGAAAGESLELVLTPSSSTYDGRYANNGWLQETPGFMTKLTWDNAAILAPKTAEKLGVTFEDLIEISVGETSVRAPVLIMPGQAIGSIGLALGYGRTAAGLVGGHVGLEDIEPTDPVGANAYQVRTADALEMVPDVKVSILGLTYPLATTQDHFPIDEMGLEGTYTRVGALVREATVEQFEEHPDFAEHAVHHPPVTKQLWENPLASGMEERKSGEYKGYAWGMTVDLSRCVGCNACLVACQSENNVPVVGKEQVGNGREMHWLRIDRYFIADPDNPDALDDPAVSSQPMACVHCETAPCEQVCPVAATVHDEEGLNSMVYNRCVGTRYCANNCPYKVRRFNYFYYNEQYDHLEYDGQLPKFESAEEKAKRRTNAALASMVLNPEVTVRTRGVMEKCTYCTQRIQKAKIESGNEGRKVEDGEIVTACQAACPADAIVFGDINNASTVVSKERNNPRAYGLLSELNTRPRTEYLARIRNPHPSLEKSESYYGITPMGHGSHVEHYDGEHGHDAEGEHAHEEHDHAESGSTAH
ncbi:TAT-variant-translocated molybdopterin oxidoreductase [Stratiformator vulcanicus]|uniref:Putative ferredoxin-like protein YdhX n=1 Tax=Stratiformator vulcanicus TaxID=2527980 RepID=A0A517R2Z7_9PLAN|nr:TAT-variant-translocated molybdopterin oxidoreductase [Stratiformator vulcanicus]QDT38231.1 putative ferredoxin-like protein YdhX precursor [Stratiformator vulcanicus]